MTANDDSEPAFVRDGGQSRWKITGLEVAQVVLDGGHAFDSSASPPR
jgi:hypothetical protein